jgi:hypothetical protein
MKTWKAVVGSTAVLVLIAGSVATAASLITSKQIKNFTIQNSDLRKGAVDSRVIKNGSIQRKDLALGALQLGGLIGGSLSSFGLDAAGNDPSSVYLPVLPADGGSELASPADANRVEQAMPADGSVHGLQVRIREFGHPADGTMSVTFLVNETETILTCVIPVGSLGCSSNESFAFNEGDVLVVKVANLATVQDSAHFLRWSSAIQITGP